MSRPAGLAVLSGFFAAGALVSAFSALALAFPGSWSEPMWRLNPEARVAFARLGPWAVLLMLTVSAACGGAAVGLWAEQRWGRDLAIGILGVNLVGDCLNAVLRADRRALLGLPIGGAMLAYLLSRRVRERLRPPAGPLGGGGESGGSEHC